MRKQLDPRIPVLINNNVKKNHRSFIVLVGDKGRDQVCTSSLVYRPSLTLSVLDRESPLFAFTSARISTPFSTMVL